MIRFTTHVTGRSSYVVQASFKDEEGTPVVPETLSWTLTDASGNVVNGRDAVPANGPGLTENIVLSGDDLALSEGRDRELRVLNLSGVFFSPIAGQKLPFAQSARFLVEGADMIPRRVRNSPRKPCGPGSHQVNEAEHDHGNALDRPPEPEPTAGVNLLWLWRVLKGWRR